MTQQSRRWLLLVPLILILLVIGAIVGLNVYRQQYGLTQQRLDAAQKLWKERGPKSYDVHVQVSGSAPGNYQIEVRDGQVTTAKRDGQPLDAPREGQAWTMPGLFQVLQEDIDNDKKVSATSFSQAEFDATNGSLTRYVRSHDTQKVEMRVSVKPVP